MATFGEKLGHLLIDRNLVPRDISQSLHLRETTAARWLEDSALPDLRQARILAKNFGVTIAYLSDDKAGVAEFHIIDEAGMSQEQNVILRLLGSLGYQRSVNRLFGLPDDNEIPACEATKVAWPSV